MKKIKLVGAVVLGSLLIAWGVSFAAGWDVGNTKPVFQSDRAGRLTVSNMVDAFTGLPLELRIAKADLKMNILSVDLFLPRGVFAEKFVYHDLYELTRFAWGKTSNVDRVQIRILQQNGEERSDRELLMAMEAKRTQAIPAGKQPDPESAAGLRGYLESRYHFTYTKRWKDQT